MLRRDSSACDPCVFHSPTKTNFDAEAPHASSLSRNFCCSGFAVATPVGVQKVVPSSQLIRFGGLPCESRGSQVVPPDAVQTGAIVTPNAVRKHRMPLRKQGSTECLYPVFSPTVFIAARVFVLHRQMAVQTAIPSMQ